MLGLYIHIPFCNRKCFYCDFFSIKYNAILADQYIRALIKHTKQFKNKKIHSVYIGGGTPSTLSLKQIQLLLESLRNIFDLSQLQEFTFELNPESSSAKKLNLLKALGVNRLSIGLQSTENMFLKFLGREHTFENFCDTYNAARNENFDNINIDLIYGLQNQSIKKWKETLQKILFFDSEHLSLYPLSLEENTLFYKNTITTNDDIQRNMYDEAVIILTMNGYNHYEISNWAKKNKESFHNTNYWRNFEYIGIGAGAAGYFNAVRYKNIMDIKKYIRLLQSKKKYHKLNDISLRCENEYINKQLYEKEKIMLGLRLLYEGLSIDNFNNPKYKAVLLKCLNDKILKKQNGQIILSQKYVYIYNHIISKFFI
ncbi:MAG: radical SAM family heme chaperone HemW [Endomicrobium sp.]|jgi:oxygen-independent coproporphyrinogen-3 oxidase|nr:radical SAM family heme chaperone HemW [Endomicrobium sp.]